MDGGIVTQAGGKAKGPRDMKRIQVNFESNKKERFLGEDKNAFFLVFRGSTNVKFYSISTRNAKKFIADIFQPIH